MFNPNFLIWILSAVIGAGSSVLLAAEGQTGDTLVIPISQQGNDAVKTPGRGETMKTVEAHFGKPLKTMGPVGTPPITRWYYDKFTVTFEYDHVVASVVIFTPQNLPPAPPNTDNK